MVENPQKGRVETKVANSPEITIDLTLIHEIGHGLIGLIDEYLGSGMSTNLNATSETLPADMANCAKTRDSAISRWGDKLGQVDPFYYEFQNTVKNTQGICTEQEVKVSITSGCANFFEPFRSNKKSIMLGDNCPIFGTINRERAEQVLSLFSGN